MVTTANKRAWVILLLTIVGLTGLRLTLAGRTELLPEEAYYWTYTKHPAMSYFDHPPMVAWCIAAGTWLLGDTELGVRFVHLLLWIGTCLALLQTAKLWFGERVALGAALLFVMLPIFAGVGFVATPDGPLVFFWTLTLLALSRALQTEWTRYWLLAGLMFGGALLSKYYALVLAPSLLLFLLLSPRNRSWLKRPQPWMALAVALVVFSPVIFWNTQHQWASFAFQSTRTVGQQGNVRQRLEVFWLMQFVTLTPLGLVLMAAAAWRGVKRGWFAREEPWNFAASFGLPVFGLFVVASFKTEVHVNWLAPAYLSLALAASALWVNVLDAGNSMRRRWWFVGTWAMGLICGAAAIMVHSSLITGKPEMLAYSHVGGWRNLAQIVRVVERTQTEQTGQKPFLIGADKYNIAAELGFYLGSPAECVNLYAFGAQGLGYRYWTDLQKFEGRPALVVSLGRNRLNLRELQKYFARIDVLEPAPITGFGTNRKSVYVVMGHGYREIAQSPIRDASLD